MKSARVWEFIANHLREEHTVAFIQVIESSGASPGRAGFELAIAPDGTRIGTIGGGVMEMNWVEQAATALRNNATLPVVRRVFHSRETKHEQSGLICSGSQTNLLYFITPSEKSAIEEIIQTFEKKQSGLLRIDSGRFSFLAKRRLSKTRTFLFTSENEWMYEEDVGVLDTVYIIGSGHVGLALSRVMSTLDFHVVAIDDRADAPTFFNNEYAHAKHCIPYASIGEVIHTADRAYAAILTTAYKSDEAALKAILDKPLKYIGLMGSEAKAKQIYDDLLAEGISQSQLDGIHSPIGLPITSYTPEEIAISIAAEIINVRNASKQDD